MSRQNGQGYIRVSGKQPLNEALRSGWPVYQVYVRGQAQDKFVRELVRLAESSGIAVAYLDPASFDRRFPGASQGIVGLVREVALRTPEEVLAGIAPGEQPLIVALDGIEDPQNLGAIVRTCHAMGAHAVVVPRRRSAAIAEGAAKASAGAVFVEPICQVSNMSLFIEWSKKQGFWVYGLDARGPNDIWSTDFSGPVVLVVGSEGRGLSRLVSERCDFLVRIPMSGTIGSLNASVACGMALYEIKRQRTRKGET